MSDRQAAERVKKTLQVLQGLVAIVVLAVVGAFFIVGLAYFGAAIAHVLANAAVDGWNSVS